MTTNNNIKTSDVIGKLFAAFLDGDLVLPSDEQGLDALPEDVQRLMMMFGLVQFKIVFSANQRSTRNVIVSQLQQKQARRVLECILRWFDAYGARQLSMKKIGQMVDYMLQLEYEELGAEKKIVFSARMAGSIVGKTLQLEKARETGRNRSTILVWDLQAINALREEYKMGSFGSLEHMELTKEIRDMSAK